MSLTRNMEIHIAILLVTTQCVLSAIDPKLTFDIQQAQEIWQNKRILGESTQFEYPLTMGGFTNCDDWSVERVFDDEFKLHANYTTKVLTLNQLAAGYYAPEIAFRNNKEADLKIEGSIVTLKGCFAACITVREFLCKSFDFYPNEKNVCSLFKVSGKFHSDKVDTDPDFVTKNPQAAHYTLLKVNEEKPACDEQETVVNHFGFGWKAMEAGWQELADDQFNIVIRENPGYHMAYVGKMLAAEKFGYGLSDNTFGTYKDKINKIANSDDKPVKLTEQQMVVVDALNALHQAETFDQGLAKMNEVFTSSEKKDDYVIKAIYGNANLLRANFYQALLTLARNNIYGLRYITHNLNPYEENKGGETRTRTTPALRNAAIDAIERYRDLDVPGAAKISMDCIDIAEYYARWSVAEDILVNLRRFLFDTTGQGKLFREEPDTIMTNGLEVPYVSHSWVRYALYEKRHFFLLQAAQFDSADGVQDDAARKSDQSKWIPLNKLRMTANDYFSSYDYIYDDHAKKIQFEDDWSTPLPSDTDDLTRASRTYYWAAAAVQKVRSGNTGVAETIGNKIQEAANTVKNDAYKTLIQLHQTVVKGSLQYSKKQYAQAMESAKEAGSLNQKLVGSSFSWEIDGVHESKEFRMLVPLGFQFKADMMNTLLKDGEAKLGDLAGVVDAYREGVNTPPLNNSRLMKGFADNLREQYGATPKRRGEEIPEFVQAYDFLTKKSWAFPNGIEGGFTPKEEAASGSDYYYERAFTDCAADEFQFMSESELCWGGYVIIGVIIAIIVIIAIVVGILCLRRKASKPVKDKETAQAFMFAGPDMSQRDDTSSYHMGTLSGNDATPYASQTLDLKRNYSGSGIDYTQRSHTLGPEGYSAH